ncbi:hypothetical protein GCM10008967_29540 [Bacillus carboniphilus]|uniref:Uncharacterized protein n=1 Tax=Bacillus carboniphilus TaxID=86663 RepID=A0ABN0WHJ6_9BACI
MLAISRLPKPSLGIQTNTIQIKTDNLYSVSVSDVLVVLAALIVLIALAVLVASIAQTALVAIIVVAVVAIIAVAIAVVVAADVVAVAKAVNHSSFRRKPLHLQGFFYLRLDI